MTEPSFTTDSKHELLALHRVFIEAKFSDDPNDRDIAASPIVNEMYGRIFSALKKDGKDWDRWLDDQKVRVISVIKQNISRISNYKWKKWGESKKKEYVRNSGFPVVLELSEIDELVRFGDETNKC